jgi:hypothetical protein
LIHLNTLTQTDKERLTSILADHRECLLNPGYEVDWEGLLEELGGEWPEGWSTELVQSKATLIVELDELIDKLRN